MDPISVQYYSTTYGCTKIGFIHSVFVLLPKKKPSVLTPLKASFIKVVCKKTCKLTFIMRGAYYRVGTVNTTCLHTLKTLNLCMLV